MKSLLLAAAISLAALAPAAAQTDVNGTTTGNELQNKPDGTTDATKAPGAQTNTAAACDDSGMKRLQASIDGTSDQMMKDNATKEMMAAQEAMKAGNIDTCAQHMGMAMQAMGTN